MKTLPKQLKLFLAIILSLGLIITPDLVYAATEGYSAVRYGFLYTGNVGQGLLDQFIDDVKDSFDDMKEWIRFDQKDLPQGDFENALPLVSKVPEGKKISEPKKVKELVDKRTERSKSYELSDGRVEVEISEDPFHYKDAKGNWQNIDHSIRKSTKESGYVYANETNSFQTFFGDQAGRLLKFKYGKHDLALGLENGITEKLEATVDKNNISYSNILPHEK